MPPDASARRHKSSFLPDTKGHCPLLQARAGATVTIVGGRGRPLRLLAWVNPGPGRGQSQVAQHMARVTHRPVGNDIPLFWVNLCLTSVVFCVFLHHHCWTQCCCSCNSLLSQFADVCVSSAQVPLIHCPFRRGTPGQHRVCLPAKHGRQVRDVPSGNVSRGPHVTHPELPHHGPPEVHCRHLAALK